MRLSRAGESDAGLRPSPSAISAVATGPRRRRWRPWRACTRARRGWPARTAAAEEPDRELLLGLRRGDLMSSAVIGLRGASVPGDLAVGLDEVGVAVGGRVEGVERVLGELHVLALGRRDEREVGRLPVEPVDPVRSGTAARSSSCSPTARWAGAAGRRRPRSAAPPLWESSWQAAQSAETSAGRTSCISSMNSAMPDPQVGGQRGGVEEQLGQVDLHVAGVGAALRRGHVDAGLPARRALGRAAGRAARTP